MPLPVSSFLGSFLGPLLVFQILQCCPGVCEFGSSGLFANTMFDPIDFIPRLHCTQEVHRVAVGVGRVVVGKDRGQNGWWFRYFEVVDSHFGARGAVGCILAGEHLAQIAHCATPLVKLISIPAPLVMETRQSVSGLLRLPPTIEQTHPRRSRSFSLGYCFTPAHASNGHRLRERTHANRPATAGDGGGPIYWL